MRGAIAYLRLYSEYRIRRGGRRIRYIQLKDTAFIYIKRVRINLADYYTLTQGSTYYSQFGFIPYDSENEILHAEGILELDQNQRRMKRQKLSKHQWFVDTFSEFVDCLRYPLIGEAIRCLFKNHPDVIVPYIDTLYQQLKLVKFNNRSWYLRL